MINPSSDHRAADTALIEAARSVLQAHGDDDVHTVAAAVLDEDGRAHVGLNLYHFTGGPAPNSWLWLWPAPPAPEHHG